MGLPKRHDRAFAEALENITNGFIENSAFCTIHVTILIKFFCYGGFCFTRCHFLISKYKCKGQICVFGKVLV